MESGSVRGHYDGLADEYDEHWVYGPDYVPWMANRITEALRLASSDRIADIGCGTGLFAREVAKELSPDQPILCIDPSEAMLSQLGTPPPPGTRPIVASAEDVAEAQAALPYAQLDAAWLKEAVHHVCDPEGTLCGLARLLAPGGRLLVAMLPASIEYPLFRAALDRFEELQPDPNHIVRHIERAGLTAELFHVTHQLRIGRDRYIEMVRSRYMSLLSTFSDRELEEGIEEMRAAHPEDVLTFPDRFAFVLGVKGEDTE